MNDRFENFVGVVYALNKEVQRIKSEKMGSLGLRGTDTMVLYYLGQSDAGFSEAELARLIHQDRAAVTRTVAKLEREGLCPPNVVFRELTSQASKNVFCILTTRESVFNSACDIGRMYVVESGIDERRRLCAVLLRDKARTSEVV